MWLVLFLIHGHLVSKVGDLNCPSNAEDRVPSHWLFKVGTFEHSGGDARVIGVDVKVSSEVSYTHRGRTCRIVGVCDDFD